MIILGLLKNDEKRKKKRRREKERKRKGERKGGGERENVYKYYNITITLL